MLMSRLVLRALRDAIIMAFELFCITNEAIPRKPVSDALEMLVDIVHS